MLGKNKLWRICAMVSTILLVTCGSADGRLSRYGKSAPKSSVGISKRSVRATLPLKNSLRANLVSKSKTEALGPHTNKISFRVNSNRVTSVVAPCLVKSTQAGGFDFDNSEICKRIDDLITAQNSTKTAIDSLKQDLTTKIAEMVASNKATQDLIQQQIKQNNQLLFDTLQKRLNSIPADLLTNPAFKEELDKLKKDILDEVNKRIADHQ
jgi:hypothetical protein